MRMGAATLLERKQFYMQTTMQDHFQLVLKLSPNIVWNINSISVLLQL